MKHLFYLLFIATFVVSCGNDNGQNTPKPKEPVLELMSEAAMSFDAQGGEGMILYNLVKGDEVFDDDNGISGQVSPVRIETEAEWITILGDESIIGTIKFVVAENLSEEPRSATITATYMTKSFGVTINQSASGSTPAVDGWAVVGSMTDDWDMASAITMDSIEGYHVAYGVEVTASDSFKFVHNGSMQEALGGNGIPAKRDYKYPTSKYGSDIRVEEGGVYDIYINAQTDTYYMMSEGKSPAEAQGEIQTGEDVWYVIGCGEPIRMNNVGFYRMASNVSIDEDGFKLHHGLTGEYGAESDVVREVNETIIFEGASEHNIKVAVESGKSYDIYIKADKNSLWVVPRGGKPDEVHECDYAEAKWFGGTNFYVYLEAKGVNFFFDCYIDASTGQGNIPEGTYTVGATSGNRIDVDGSQVANESGKARPISGTMTLRYGSEDCEIELDVTTERGYHLRAAFTGDITYL